MNPPQDNLHAQLERRVQFETLLANLSARFINVPADEVDRQIEEAQGQVCEMLGLNRSTLFQIVEGDDKNFVTTHCWVGSGFTAFPKVFSREALPWGTAKISRGETVCYSSIAQLPPEAAQDARVLQVHGPLSNLTFPLMADGTVFGALAFGSMSEERNWPDLLVNRLRLVAEIFANALDRQRTYRVLRESKDRMSLALTSAKLGMWTWNVKTDEVWLSDEVRSLFGLSPGATVSSETLRDLIHPEDRERRKTEMDRALKSGLDYQVEYRVQQPDGSNRWVCSRGRCHRDADGNAERVIGVMGDVTETRQREEQLQKALDEVKKLKDKLRLENEYLRKETSLLKGPDKFIGKSQAIRQTVAQARQVAAASSTVLLLGETGTGKELLAAFIHENSPRRERVMVHINCAAIPAALIESELFGREKGAYTGALSKQVGRFELADKSTIFLDEIGELPLETQAKLLRVLQERQIERLGSSKSINVDVRIIAATNRRLEQAIHDGRFREDLYYRLNVFPITVPPLRERREDIPQLVWTFAGEFGKALGKNIESITNESMASLQNYPWPGNVRELRNVIERALITTDGPTLKIELPKFVPETNGATARSFAIKDHERDHIEKILEMTGWRIRGKNGAAEILEINPTTLESRMARLGIVRKRA